jgi:hypothetical protein
LYHINAVDTVTQWQVVGCVETIAEAPSARARIDPPLLSKSDPGGL